MSGTVASERCFDYVHANAQAMNRLGPAGRVDGPPRVVTISRQAGAGAHVVGEDLAALLQAGTPAAAVPWKVFDRDLVERVLEEHDLPERMAKFMPEDRISAISDTLDELFGLHPSSLTLVRRTADTILHLAELGNAVVIGRAGNLITMDLPGAFHVRLVGSVERRIASVQEHLGLDRTAASEYIRTRDLGRRRYVRKYYGKDIDDPLLYDLVLNTDRAGYRATARVIAEGASARWNLARERTSRGVRRGPVAV